MPETSGNVKLVAYCGLYCGACRRYRRGGCPGCAENARATWCKVRSCCQERKYASCADCTTVADVAECRSFTNPIARVFGWLFNSDRRKCIVQVKTLGLAAHADAMARSGCQSLPRGSSAQRTGPDR